jgi:hypothetical protein
LAVLLAWAPAGVALGGNHQLGGGVQYWRTIDDIDAADFEFDEEGLSYLAAYQYLFTSLFRLEINLAVFPDDFGASNDTVFAPQALALVGAGIYGGLGIGTYIVDGTIGEDPYYNIRVGFNIEVLPTIWLDINGNYQFTNFDDIKTIDEDIDTDTVTLGAMVRFEF